jgi:hypothetical protein
MLRETYGIEKKHLPQYSPFLNPIEYAFNKLKTLVKEPRFNNRQELIQVIEQKITEITPEDTSDFIKKAQSYYPQVPREIPFTGKPLDPEIRENQFPLTNEGRPL